MRGKQRWIGENGPYGGLIPAHAGKTKLAARRCSVRWAHPRACGENQLQPWAAATPAGSSPRMRGKPGGHVTVVNIRGLIPAHAGKTGGRWSRQRQSGAHPRACGENPARQSNAPASPGSSPRMRGKRGSLSSSKRHAGLIPAHAGKTSTTSSPATSSAAHPRACGENSAPGHLMILTNGSSPRMRGKQTKEKSRNFNEGLIPAHAGKTDPRALECLKKRAHPRACGENIAPAPSNPSAKWLIPAHAGKTFGTGSRTCQAGAHPRACGENPETPAQTPWEPGSSPRMRGKRHAAALE